MTVAPQGQTTTLVAEFFEYGGGPAIDITGLTITITRLSDGVVVVGPTGVGIQHVATGNYAYPWAVGATFPVGDYLVTWNGTYLGLPTQASEVVTVETSQTDGVDAGPCGVWPVQWGNCNLTGVSPEVTGLALRAASEVLWSLSGRRFGVCQLTVRPCRRECFGDVWGFPWGNWYEWGVWPRPFFYSGVWYNLTCGNGCGGSCSCTPISETYLPDPVSSVVQVKVDGQILPTDAYRVDDYRKLVRTDGGIWPWCNDLNLEDTQPNTWSVTVRFGEEVPTLGQLAVGELACQFAKLIAGDDDCALPKPVQQLVRQGVSMTFLDPNELFANGRLGLYLSDLFITTYNPHGLGSRSEVYDIDAGGQDYRITGTS